MDPLILLSFVGASVLLALAPGPDIIFVITQGLVHGRRAAMATTLGLCTGIVGHTTAAALGVSAIFMTSALAFETLKYFGAAYLLYLAYKTLTTSRKSSNVDNPESTFPKREKLSDGALYRRGILMNLLNPKVALFFLAFLPQFTKPAAGHLTIQMLILGVLFMMTTVVVFGAAGVFAGTLGRRLLERPSVARMMDTFASIVYIGLALKLALTKR